MLIAGSNKPTSMPTIVITTSSSTRLRPRRWFPLVMPWLPGVISFKNHVPPPGVLPERTPHLASTAPLLCLQTDLRAHFGTTVSFVPDTFFRPPDKCRARPVRCGPEGAGR